MRTLLDAAQYMINGDDGKCGLPGIMRRIRMLNARGSAAIADKKNKKGKKENPINKVPGDIGKQVINTLNSQEYRTI